MKDASKANRGMQLEELISLANGLYYEDGIACVHKVPTEFLPLRDYRGIVVNCKVTHKSCVDYLGRYKNIPVAIEAKHTAEERIAFDRVEPHQASFLDTFCGNGYGMGFVCVSFAMTRFFVVPWCYWSVARKAWLERPRGSKTAEKISVDAFGSKWITPGRASVKADELLPKWEIKVGGKFLFPYLKNIKHYKEYELSCLKK